MLLIRSLLRTSGHVLAFVLRTRRIGVLLVVVVGGLAVLAGGALTAAGALGIYPFA